MTHKPRTINKFKTGLVQYQPNQILVDDAFPVLENAIVYRNTVRRRESWKLLGRLTRTLTSTSLGNTGSSPWSFNIYNLLGITGEPNAQISIGSVVITILNSPDIVFTDQGDGTLTSTTPGNSGTIIYIPVENNTVDANVTLTHTAGAGVPTQITFTYYPALPSMALFDRIITGNAISNVYFDTKYAYRYFTGIGFQELLPGTTWSMNDYNLPSPTNYWTDKDNLPIFWVTSNTGTSGDPIRYTNGVSLSSWYDFTPVISPAPDPANNIRLTQCKFLIPYRGRLYAFNTYEGTSLSASTHFVNRIRCCAIGNPFTEVSPIITSVNANAWNDTIPGAGNGYFEDLPTTEEIIGVWQVVNQIVIKTTNKSWILSNLGSNIAPFKVDLLDDSQGTLSGFGTVNMGGFIEGIGDRSITATSPTTVTSIDQKILDFVFNINRDDEGMDRVYGIRDFRTRINSFIYPFQPDDDTVVKFPNRRLLHNYDNNSWGIYEDSLTCLGYFRDKTSLTWAQATFSWADAGDADWGGNSSNAPVVAAGNQQGFFGLLDSAIEEGPSLAITAITSFLGLAVVDGEACKFTCPDHNMTLGTVIELSGFSGDYESLNGTVGSIENVDTNSFLMFSYNPDRDMFNIPVTAPEGIYIGGGLVKIRRNFSIVTKAFNLLESGQSMHVSYVDALVNTNQNVSVQIAVYVSMNNSSAVNLTPQNTTSGSIFGNKISLSNPTTYLLNEVNNRALINQRGNMLTLELNLSNEVMASDNFSTPFLLSSMTIWEREAGRPLMPFGSG